MPHCHLILGGARSGKSRYSEKAALSLYSESLDSETPYSKTAKAKLIYLATGTAGDQEMANRIEHHQERRGPEWQLIEEPLALAPIIEHASSNTTILVDCLTLWLSNCLHQECWLEKRGDLLDALARTSANIIMVSNEVGSGIVPMGELSRQFVDESGWLHQQIAAIASDVTLVVAGLEMPLKRSQL